MTNTKTFKPQTLQWPLLGPNIGASSSPKQHALTTLAYLFGIVCDKEKKGFLTRRDVQASCSSMTMTPTQHLFPNMSALNPIEMKATVNGGEKQLKTEYKPEQLASLLQVPML